MEQIHSPEVKERCYKLYAKGLPLEEVARQSGVKWATVRMEPSADPDWEAGDVKLDDQGNPRTGNQGQIKYERDKSKVTYKKC